MAIAPGGVSTAYRNGLYVTVPQPTGLADGDFLVAFVVGGGTSGTITAPAGWTTTYSGVWRDGMRPAGIFTRQVTSAASESSSYTFALSWGAGDYGQATVIAYSGIDTTTPIDGLISAYTATGNGTTVSLSVTTTQPGSVIVASTYGATGPAYGTPSNYNGLTSRSQSGVAYGQFVGDQTISTASTAARVITFGYTTIHGGVMLALRAASTGSAQPLTGTSAGTSSATASRLSLSHPLTGQAAGTSSASGSLPDTNPGTVAGMIAFDFTLRFT